MTPVTLARGSLRGNVRAQVNADVIEERFWVCDSAGERYRLGWRRDIRGEVESHNLGTTAIE